MTNPSSNKSNFFGKEEALILSAMAILIMIWHHLFGFPDFYKEGTEWHSALGRGGDIAVTIFAKIGNICVPMFAIMSGYALGVNNKAFDSWQKRGVRLLKFLGSYWIVFALFLIVGYFDGAVLPSSNQFLENLFGVNTGPKKWVNVSHAWYVAFYIEFLILVPVLVWSFKRSNFLWDIVALVALYGLVGVMTHLPWSNSITRFCGSITPIISVGIGILLAKYNLFERIHDAVLRFAPLHVILIFTLDVIVMRYLCVVYPFNNKILSIATAILNVALPTLLVILCVEWISRMKNIHLRKPLIFIGSLSMYLWFLHGIFSTGNHFMESPLFSLKDPLLIFIVCLIALIPIAYLLDKALNFLFKKLKV